MYARKGNIYPIYNDVEFRFSIGNVPNPGGKWRTGVCLTFFWVIMREALKKKSLALSQENGNLVTN